jgi:L-lactate dehydrogenase complex protein LldG
MKKSEIDIMNKSFAILNERRSHLLHDERTQDLKEKVKGIRKYSISNLNKLLNKGITKLQENGNEVIFAETSEKALESILDIVKNEVMVAKSKSNTAGEIGLSEFLETNGIAVLETDLGDRIVQFDPTSRPSHPIGPASHYNIEKIADLASKGLNSKISPEPRAILNAVKADVLNKLSKCNIGITGANSLAAEDGAIIMVHNEGNINLVSMLDTHIVIVGIDKLVRTIEEAISVVKLETIYATGKKAPAYMNVISSPSKTADIEQILMEDMYGPQRVVVILLDNGRSQSIKEGGECLLCIGCGSCIVTCPIYNAIGYDFGYRRYLGGRGVVLSSFMEDEKSCFDSGLFSCTLCGLCTLECPLSIKTNEMIEELRRKSVKSHLSCEKHVKIASRIKKTGSPF